MFYFVTYLDLITLKIRLYEYTQSKNQVEELLNNVAINFIRTENGERRVNTAYVEKIEDIQEDGYYLICSKEVPNVIDVYYRKTNVVSGWFLNGADISVDKVGRFSVSETSLNLPSEVEQTSTKVIKPQCQNQQLSFWSKNQKSLLSEYIKQELEADERIILKNKHFVALIPYWAVWPYETMIVPLNHYNHINQLNKEEEMAFAEIIKDLTTKYDNLFETSFPYSSGIHQSPTDGDHPEWHFHMSFYPPLLRSATVKKFMVGYEMFANPQRDITAEQAAETLKGLNTRHFTTT